MQISGHSNIRFLLKKIDEVASQKQLVTSLILLLNVTFIL